MYSLAALGNCQGTIPSPLLTWRSNRTWPYCRHRTCSRCRSCRIPYWSVRRICNLGERETTKIEREGIIRKALKGGTLAISFSLLLTTSAWARHVEFVLISLGKNCTRRELLVSVVVGSLITFLRLQSQTELMHNRRMLHEFIHIRNEAFHTAGGRFQFQFCTRRPAKRLSCRVQKKSYTWFVSSLYVW